MSNPTNQTVPPSISLALMACRLAMVRTWPDKSLDWMNGSNERGTFMPTPRRFCIGSAGKEFYAILDRITRGDAP